MKVGVVLLVTLVGLDTIASARAQPDSVVFPTGEFPADVLSVQAAIDAGGTILLKAVNVSGVPTPFEFGTFGGTILTTDVTLIGESIEGAKTRIHGGAAPFRGWLTPVRSAIRGIHFDAPRGGAVVLNFSSGFEFSNNEVTDVIGLPFAGTVKGQAVWIDTVQGGVTGTVTIADNIVERVYAELSYGVVIVGSRAATTIIRNVFRDTRDTAILVVGASQPVWIEDNLIVPGDEPYDAAFFSPGNGIFGGQGSGPLHIRRNTILCGNPWADGIALSGNLAFPNRVPGSSVVEHNDVSMHASMFGGITIYGQVDPSLVANNRVQGDGAFALLVTTVVGDEDGRGHVFRGNNLTGFVGSMADVFFDVHTRENVLVGNPGTVLDLGIDNRITGFSNVGPIIGAEIHAAHVRKRALLAAISGVFGQ